MITGVKEVDGHQICLDNGCSLLHRPLTGSNSILNQEDLKAQFLSPTSLDTEVTKMPILFFNNHEPLSDPERPRSAGSNVDLSANNALRNEVSISDKPATAEKTRLELILGPMGSGKSTELSRRLQRKKLYKKVFAVSTIADTRYGDHGIITHDGLVTPCLRVKNLEDILTNAEYQKADVVGIDEANFFSDLPEFIRSQLELTNKTFIISGLDGDRHKKPFGRVLELIPDADRKDFLTALCKRCADGTEAPFTIEVIAFDGQVKVGGTDAYEAVCRKHYDFIRYCQQVDQLKRSHPELHIDKLTVLHH